MAETGRVAGAGAAPGAPPPAPEPRTFGRFVDDAMARLRPGLGLSRYVEPSHAEQDAALARIAARDARRQQIPALAEGAPPEVQDQLEAESNDLEQANWSKQTSWMRGG